MADINGEHADNTVASIIAEGGKAVAVNIDLSRVEEIPPMIESVVSQLGRIDILVNSAGFAQTKPLLEITEDDWDKVIDINQKGLFFCMQHAARRMIAQAETARATPCAGKIVNLSSISGRRGRALQAAYAASKAAIISLTQSAALAFAPFGINVNAIAPSVVLTPMFKQVARDRGKLSGGGSDTAIQSFIDRIPLGRVGTVEEMASAVAFLCSSEADYITGQCLNVDGGFEMD